MGVFCSGTGWLSIVGIYSNHSVSFSFPWRPWNGAWVSGTGSVRLSGYGLITNLGLKCPGWDFHWISFSSEGCLALPHLYFFLNLFSGASCPGHPSERCVGIAMAGPAALLELGAYDESYDPQLASVLFDSMPEAYPAEPAPCTIPSACILPDPASTERGLHQLSMDRFVLTSRKGHKPILTKEGKGEFEQGSIGDAQPSDARIQVGGQPVHQSVDAKSDRPGEGMCTSLPRPRKTEKNTILRQGLGSGDKSCFMVCRGCSFLWPSGLVPGLEPEATSNHPMDVDHTQVASSEGLLLEGASDARKVVESVCGAGLRLASGSPSMAHPRTLDSDAASSWGGGATSQRRPPVHPPWPFRGLRTRLWHKHGGEKSS